MPYEERAAEARGVGASSTTSRPAADDALPARAAARRRAEHVLHPGLRALRRAAARARAPSTTTAASASSSTATSTRSRRSSRRSTRTRRRRSSTRSGSWTSTATHPAPYTLVSAEDVERGRLAVQPRGAERARARARRRASGTCSTTSRRLERGRQVRAHDLAVPRDARRHRPRARLGRRGGRVLPHDRAAEPAGLPGQGRSIPLTEHYSVIGPGGDGRARRRARSAQRNDALVEQLLDLRRRRRSRGQAKSHCVAWTIDDLLEGTRDDRAARGEGLPARGLHVARRRPRRRRLHGRGRRGVRALRRRRHARRSLDRPDRAPMAAGL